ncbi:MAG: hypothetical protein AAGA50_29090 [Pseudomonadota bacterium]
MSDGLLEIISNLVRQHPDRLNELSAGILAAARFDICRDSRSFARKFGIAHALVLRECVSLAEEHDLIELESRQDRSQRLFYSLRPDGHTILSEAA